MVNTNHIQTASVSCGIVALEAYPALSMPRFTDDDEPRFHTSTNNGDGDDDGDDDSILQWKLSLFKEGWDFGLVDDKDFESDDDDGISVLTEDFHYYEGDRDRQSTEMQSPECNFKAYDLLGSRLGKLPKHEATIPRLEDFSFLAGTITEHAPTLKTPLSAQLYKQVFDETCNGSLSSVNAKRDRSNEVSLLKNASGKHQEWRLNFHASQNWSTHVTTSVNTTQKSIKKEKRVKFSKKGQAASKLFSDDFRYSGLKLQPDKVKRLFWKMELLDKIQSTNTIETHKL